LSYAPLVFLISLVPAAELRFSIPLALGLKVAPTLIVFLICVGLNLLVIPITFIGLDLLAPPLILRSKRIAAIFAWFSKRGHGRKWGVLGLALFVGVPLPATGAYTGVLIAYVLRMKRAQSALAIAAGVIIAGTLVTLASVGVISLLGI
jgi:uncharacterized membrane protein